MDHRIVAAVANNAAWCGLVCRAQGIGVEQRDGLWVAARRPPALYPDAITLASDVSAGRVLRAVGERSPCAVKDSFAKLPLDEHGFEELFTAQWFFRAPTDARHAPGARRWSVVATPRGLTRWMSAARLGEVIPAGLLNEPSVRFLALCDKADVIAGAVLSRTGPVVGVSNVFATRVAAEAVWAALPHSVAAVVPGLPLVGYERGDALAAALASGFKPIADLRIWGRDAADSSDRD